MSRPRAAPAGAAPRPERFHPVRNPLYSLLFFVVVVPAGLLARLVRDPMTRRPQPGATSYWIPADGPVAGRKDAR